MPEQEQKRILCTLTGNIQGVGFRWSARERALDLGVTGYVRNLDNGRVEIVAEGREQALEAFQAFCYRGPHGGTITNVDISEQPPTGEFATFEIRH